MDYQDLTTYDRVRQVMFVLVNRRRIRSNDTRHCQYIAGWRRNPYPIHKLTRVTRLRSVINRLHFLVQVNQAAMLKIERGNFNFNNVMGQVEMSQQQTFTLAVLRTCNLMRKYIGYMIYALNSRLRYTPQGLIYLACAHFGLFCLC